MIAVQSNQTPTENPLALLTAPEAAKQLRINVRTLQKFVASGELRCVRIGRAVRYRPADLADFINRHAS